MSQNPFREAMWAVAAFVVPIGASGLVTYFDHQGFTMSPMMWNLTPAFVCSRCFSLRECPFIYAGRLCERVGSGGYHQAHSLAWS